MGGIGSRLFHRRNHFHDPFLAFNNIPRRDPLPHEHRFRRIRLRRDGRLIPRMFEVPSFLRRSAVRIIQKNLNFKSCRTTSLQVQTNYSTTTRIQLVIRRVFFGRKNLKDPCIITILTGAKSRTYLMPQKKILKRQSKSCLAKYSKSMEHQPQFSTIGLKVRKCFKNIFLGLQVSKVLIRIIQTTSPQSTLLRKFSRISSNQSIKLRYTQKSCLNRNLTQTSILTS